MATTNDSGSMVGKVFLFGMVGLLVLFLASFMFKELPDTQLNTGGQTVDQHLRGGLTQEEVRLSTVDFTDEEWNSIAGTAAGFNLDVYIPSGQVTMGDANSANDALRSCAQNGTISVISETFSMRLHLICRDEQSKKEYVVIITRIKRTIDAFRNSTSSLVTAFELKDLNAAAYINNVVNVQKAGILIRIAFKAGELFFSPYK